MNYVVVVIATFVLLVWYIRPLYNFFAKRKYKLLDEKDHSLSKAIQSSLPAIAFYTIVLGLLLYPVYTNNLINSIESGSIILIELIITFIITRIDKRQTKYTVNDKGIEYRWKYIKWKDGVSVKFKKSLFLVLHKPRFIVSSKGTTIVIPVLSKNIKSFVYELEKHDKKLGKYASDLYLNTRQYYIENEIITKKMNKHKK